MREKQAPYSFRSIKYDNRGASLLIVLGLFVLLTVVAANMLMLVNAGNTETAEEYETEQTNLIVSSIYETLNAQMESDSNPWKDAFVQDTTTYIDVTGFESPEREAITVSMEVTLKRNQAEVQYEIGTPDGETYRIYTKYNCYGTGDELKATLKECTNQNP
ncbi:MAG: hypothetical protein IJ833_07905 [Lachnospiraceae bacterium]|nr:hypothetical protein [Lachnospiraceae bacterium]